MLAASDGLAVDHLQRLDQGHVTYLALVCRCSRTFDMQRRLCRVVHLPIKVLLTLSRQVLLVALVGKAFAPVSEADIALSVVRLNKHGVVDPVGHVHWARIVRGCGSRTQLVRTTAMYRQLKGLVLANSITGLLELP